MPAPPIPLAGTAATPTGPGYDVVLLGHVGCAVVGLLTVVVSGIQAARLLGAARRDRPVEPSLSRYFAPGVNWAGRALYGVPVLGFVLIALSNGSISTGDPWVLTGLGLWGAAAALAEGVLWPAERRIQTHLVAPPVGAVPEGPGAPPVGPGPCAVRAARTVCASAVAVAVVVLVAMVVMVAQP